MDEEQIAATAKALAHPARIRIVKLLARQKECMGGEVFAELPLAQSTISQHLAVLKEAGVVASHSVGSGSVYCLDPGIVRAFSDGLLSIIATAPSCSPDPEGCR